ncbi:MAG: hypothetical protein WAQ52_06925 [Terriglobales bacterium]
MDKPELSSEDRERIRKSAQLKVKLEKVLEAVIPSATDDEVDSLSHDLTDLWDLAQQHNEKIAEVLLLGGPEHQQKLDEILSDLLYGDVTELEYHIESLKKTLPKIIERLSSET